MNPKLKQDIANSIYAATAPIIAVNEIQRAGIADLDTTKLEFRAAPAAANSTGTAGQIAYASGYLYVCVATDTWQRAELTTWT